MSAFRPLLGDQRTCRRHGPTDVPDPIAVMRGSEFPQRKLTIEPRFAALISLV
jgi:hypothetical protein